MDVTMITGSVRDVVTSVAVIVGGVWAYFKFVRGRTFARRAELDTVSTLHRNADSLHLSASVAFKNTGSSKLSLNKDMKVVRLFGITEEIDDRTGRTQWERICTIPIFEQHAWVEAQETIMDTAVCSLPPYAAYQIEAFVGTPRRLISRKGTLWQSREVEFLPPRAGRNGDDSHSMLTQAGTKVLIDKITKQRRSRAK